MARSTRGLARARRAHERQQLAGPRRERDASHHRRARRASTCRSRTVSALTPCAPAAPAPLEPPRQPRQRQRHGEVHRGAQQPRQEPAADVRGQDRRLLGQLHDRDHRDERAVLEQRDEVVGHRRQRQLERLGPAHEPQRLPVAEPQRARRLELARRHGLRAHRDRSRSRRRRSSAPARAPPRPAPAAARTTRGRSRGRRAAAAAACRAPAPPTR